MNLKKIVIVYSMLLVSLATMACQKGGNYGHYDRKMYKKYLHGGPNLNQLKKQAVWELFQTKKPNKNQELQTLSLMPKYECSHEVVPLQHLPCEHRISSSIRLPKAMAIFTILCMMVANSNCGPYYTYTPISMSRLTDVGYNAIDRCWDVKYDMQREIPGEWSYVTQTLEEYKGKIKGIQLPDFPDILRGDCPSVGSPNRKNQKRANAMLGGAWAFLTSFDECRHELARQIQEYHQYQLKSSCQEMSKWINEDKLNITSIKEQATMDNDKIGELHCWPDTFQMQCPQGHENEWIEKGWEFLTKIQECVKEYETRKTLYESRQTCLKLAELFNENKPDFISLQKIAHEYKDQIGEINFEIFDMQCPHGQEKEWCEKAFAVWDKNEECRQELVRRLTELQERIEEENKQQKIEL